LHFQKTAANLPPAEKGGTGRAIRRDLALKGLFHCLFGILQAGEKRVGCGVALGRWAGAGHNRPSSQLAAHPPMSLGLSEQTGVPSSMAVQPGGCRSR